MKKCVLLITLVISSTNLFGSNNPPVTIKIDPSATYLRTRGEYPPDSPAIDLEGLGFQAGDLIKLEVQGAFVQSSGIGYDHRNDLLGVFSSSSTLMPQEGGTHRVPDAIDAGIDFISRPSYYLEYSTDIAEDFEISSYDPAADNSLIIRIPIGARYLFVSPNDNYFIDNYEYTDDFSLSIMVVPEPATLSLLAIGGLALLRRQK